MEYFSFKSNEKKASDFYKNKLYFKHDIFDLSFKLENISSSKTRFNRKLRLG